MNKMVRSEWFDELSCDFADGLVMWWPHLKNTWRWFRVVPSSRNEPQTPKFATWKAFCKDKRMESCTLDCAGSRYWRTSWKGILGCIWMQAWSRGLRQGIHTLVPGLVATAVLSKLCFAESLSQKVLKKAGFHDQTVWETAPRPFL